MIGAIAGRLSRYVALGFAPADDEPERIRKAATTLIVSLVIVLSPLWIATYLALGRPLSAAIPASYAVVSVATLAYLFRAKDGHFFLRGQIAMLFALPVILMWSLGGFVQGSVVILWSLTAPLLALINWGRRAAALWFIAFLAAVIASGLFERFLSAAIAGPPEGVQTAFFVMNVGAPVAAAMAALIYFVRQRDLAAARSESLLLNILPAAIAERLKARQTDVADRYEAASVLFVDIVDFTAFADRTSPERLVELLGRVFGTLDDLVERHDLEKIKTLGDGYLAISGVPVQRSDHATAAARLALDIPPALGAALRSDWPDLRVRAGIATGAVVAGVIGRRRFSYDIWGDTVNTASRMASLAEPGSVVITAETASALSDEFRVEAMADVAVKGKGVLRPYRLIGTGPSA
jgi:adenylate cyclase